MKRIALTLIVALLPLAAQAKPVPTSVLKKQWMALNEECRGGPHQPEDAVCRKRDAVERALERRGQCWAYSDPSVFPYDYRWHDCRRARP
jgi:hypothetical protein